MSSPSRPTSQPIEVNFNVEIDASGNLTVFSKEGPQVSNVIVAEKTLPVNTLYDSASGYGLIELWEPSEAQGDIHVQLANTMLTPSGGLDLSGQYQIFARRLAEGFQAILCDTFDCSGATPFNNYTSNVEYYKQRDFGRVALATYAHYMFGHVDATAAITNDKAFVEAMLSLSDKGDSEVVSERIAAWTKNVLGNVQLWNDTSTGTDANLAIRLVKAIVQKGLSNNTASAIPVVSSVNEIDTHPYSLAKIVAQVVGQDASRLMDNDTSERTLNQHIALRFYAGDIIYINIRLQTPNINIGLMNQLVNITTFKNIYVETNFTLKIKLEDVIPITPSGYFTYIDETNTIVTGYIGTPTGGNLIIPEGVEQIDGSAFLFNSLFTSVTLPSSLRVINNYAFAGTAITSIIIPSTVTYVGMYAFGSCMNLTEFTLQSNISYSMYVLSNCQNLASVIIEDGTQIIPVGAFNLCSKLTTINIPSSVTIIGNAAFKGTGLTTITLPSSITKIYAYTFNRSKLISIIIPTSVTEIEANAFTECLYLTSASIPETCIVDPNAFNTNITTITFY